MNSLFAIAGRLVVRGAQFISFAVIARSLSTAEMGWFGIVTTAIALAAAFGSLGLRQSIAFWVGQGRISAGDATGTAVALSIPLSLCSAAAVYLALGSSRPAVDDTWTLLALCVGVFGSLALTLLQGVQLGKGDIRSFAAVDAAPRVFMMVAVVTAVLMGAHVGIDAALWMYAGGFLAALPFALRFALRSSARLRVRVRELPSMLRYGVIFAVNLTLLMLVGRLAMFSVGHFMGPVAAGEFYAALRLSEIVLEIATSVAMVAFAGAATSRGSESPFLSQAHLRTSRLMLWGFTIVAIPVALAAQPITQLVLGAGYAEATGLLQIMAVALGPIAARKVLYSTVAGRGRPGFGTPAIAAGAIFSFVAAWLAVPWFGLAGAAWALVAGQVLLFLAYVISCKSKFELRVIDFLVLKRDDINLPIAAAKAAFASRMSRRNKTAPAEED